MDNDEDTSTSENTTPNKTPSPSVQHEQKTNQNENVQFDFNLNLTESSNSSTKADTKPTILTNPINYQQTSNKITESVKLSDASADSSSSDKMSDSFSTTCNLIPINSSSMAQIDNLSINSYQSENSNEVNFSSPNEIFTLGSFTTTEAVKRPNPSKTSATENLSLAEMREVVLTMIQRKDQVEELNRNLKNNLDDEISKSAVIAEKFGILEKGSNNMRQIYENKIQNLENENKLLKDQLKKYVSAVQMIRSNNTTNTSQDSPSQDTIPAIPALNQNLLRDYSYEAEQYEQKLIQVKKKLISIEMVFELKKKIFLKTKVAEMHGELMEFNSRLHRTLNFKNLQIEKLKNELVELRGPVRHILSFDYSTGKSELTHK